MADNLTLGVILDSHILIVSDKDKTGGGRVAVEADKEKDMVEEEEEEVSTRSKMEEEEEASTRSNVSLSTGFDHAHLESLQVYMIKSSSVIASRRGICKIINHGHCPEFVSPSCMETCTI